MTLPALPTDWTLTDVREDERPLLARLLQLYLYDFSEIDPDDCRYEERTMQRRRFHFVIQEFDTRDRALP